MADYNIMQNLIATVKGLIGGGSGGNRPHESALFEVRGTDGGILPPRLTQAERLAINNPTNGLFLQQTDQGSSAGLWHYNNDAWVKLGAAGPGTGGNPIRTTVSATDMDFIFVYHGSTAPTATKAAAGSYTVTVPDGTFLLGWQANGNNTNLSSGNLTVKITYTNGIAKYGNVGIVFQSNGQQANLSSLGITLTQVPENSSTTMAYTFPNMSGFGASGFRILANII